MYGLGISVFPFYLTPGARSVLHGGRFCERLEVVHLVSSRRNSADLACRGACWLVEVDIGVICLLGKATPTPIFLMVPRERCYTPVVPKRAARGVSGNHCW